MKSEAGESTASINARRDDEEMDRVMLALQEGATLYRPPKLDRYYVTRGLNNMGGGSLSKRRVRSLEAGGKIRMVGEFRYALAES